MKKYYGLVMLLIIGLTGPGCAHVRDFGTEIVKGIWGSSTRALEKARGDAIRKTFQCTLDECFEAVLALTQMEAPEPVVLDESGDTVHAETDEEEDLDVLIRKSTKVLDLFIKNRKKQHIVVMGIPGNVNTTEAGIFFDSAGNGSVRVEIASLSKSAKATVSEIVFKELGEQYREVSP